MSKPVIEVEEVEKLALRLKPDELRDLVKRLTAKVEGRIVIVTHKQHAHVRRVITKSSDIRITARKPSATDKFYTDDYYPTLDELRALPPEERNRRVKLALTRSHNQTHDDLEGYTSADFDDGSTIE